MLNFKKKIFHILLLFSTSIIYSQSSIPTDSVANTPSTHLSLKKLIIPGALISYGLVSLRSESLKSFDREVKNSLMSRNKTGIDDFTLLAPALSVYALSAFGEKGKHSLKSKTITITTAYLISASLFVCLKSGTSITRPDGSDQFSFPSGHTAIAFAGAEFLNQEYSEVSIWYGISGYALATATGYLRMYNNKHWFSDVLTGAGIGILSTKIAYLITPYLERTVFKPKNSKTTTMLTPFFDGTHSGIGMTIHWK